MKVLLLGGTGVIGSNIITLLRNTQNYDVYVSSRSRHNDVYNIHYLCFDATNETEIKKAINDHSYDVVVDFMVYYDLQSFKRIANYWLSKCSQYIFFSSARVFSDDNPVSENTAKLLDCSNDDSFVNSNDYAIVKAKEENYLKNHSSGNWTIVRPYITYDVNRLQLGTYEKEEWLFRCLNDRLVFFDRGLLHKKTTMTKAIDVASRTIALFLKKESMRQSYNIVSSEYVEWKDVLSIYAKAFKKAVGSDLKIKIDDSTTKKIYGTIPQFKYDRMFDRVFNNNKIIEATNLKEFVPLEEGLTDCVSTFLKNVRWGPLNVRVQAKLDLFSKDFTPLKEFKSFKCKVLYLLYRFSIKK